MDQKFGHIFKTDINNYNFMADFKQSQDIYEGRHRKVYLIRVSLMQSVSS